MRQPFLQLIPDSDHAVFLRLYYYCWHRKHQSASAYEILEGNVILMWRGKRNSYAENSYFEKEERLFIVIFVMHTK